MSTIPTRSMFQTGASELHAGAARAGYVYGLSPLHKRPRVRIGVRAIDENTRQSGAARAHGVEVRRRTETRATPGKIAGGIEMFRNRSNGKLRERGELHKTASSTTATPSEQPETAASVRDPYIPQM